MRSFSTLLQALSVSLTCFATDSRPEIEKKQTSTTKTYRHSGSDTPETRNTRGKAWDRPGRVEPSEPVLRFGTSWNTLFRFWPGFSVGKQVAEDRNKVRPSPKLLLSNHLQGSTIRMTQIWEIFLGLLMEMSPVLSVLSVLNSVDLDVTMII